LYGGELFHYKKPLGAGQFRGHSVASTIVDIFLKSPARGTYHPTLQKKQSIPNTQKNWK